MRGVIAPLLHVFLWYGKVVPEDVWGSECLVPHILDLGTSWRCQLQGSP
jgi:hypothetical protein